MSEQSHRSTQITPFHLVVIGAGASGLACAIRMAQVLDAHDLRDAVRIEVYEASRKVGHSILASGNGRCNYSNTKIYETADTDVSTIRTQARVQIRAQARVQIRTQIRAQIRLRRRNSSIPMLILLRKCVQRVVNNVLLLLSGFQRWGFWDVK